MVQSLENRDTTIAASQSSTKPLLIEVMGPAGAGKTSLIDAISDHNKGFVLSPRPGFCRRAVAFAQVLLSNPGLLSKVRGMSRDDFRAMVYLRAWHAMYSNHNHREITAFDHGPLYRIAKLREFCSQLSGSAQFQRWLTRWTNRWLETLDMIILLDAPNDILMERIVARGEFRVVMTVSPSEAARRLDSFRHAFEQVLEPSRNVERSPSILRFDTSAVSRADLIQKVLCSIESMGTQRDQTQSSGNHDWIHPGTRDEQRSPITRS